MSLVMSLAHDPVLQILTGLPSTLASPCVNIVQVGRTLTVVSLCICYSSPREDSEGNAFLVCLSVCLSGRETIAPIDWFFLHEMYYARGSVLLGSGSGSGLKNLFNHSSALRDRTKYAMKVHHNIKRAL